MDPLPDDLLKEFENPAFSRRKSLFTRKFLHFYQSATILFADGQMLGIPSLGLNRFLTTKF
jgi:hypothetical protein